VLQSLKERSHESSFPSLFHSRSVPAKLVFPFFALFLSSLFVSPFYFSFSHQVAVIIYDVGSGEVALNARLLPYLEQIPDSWLTGTYEIIVSSFERVLNTNTDFSDPTIFLQSATSDIVAAISSSAWFCISCIVVLAIGLPLVANYIFLSLASKGENPKERKPNLLLKCFFFFA
jgi:hypothetical protein